MPQSLLNRCHPDSIREFRAAAQQRGRDAEVLASNERRTAAIYFWGYAVEMTLKAAYFEVIGFPDSQSIRMADLRAAVQRASQWTIPFRNYHDLSAWAVLLVSTRAATPGLIYPTPGYGNQVVREVRRVSLHWQEQLRYHKNQAYGYEMLQVQTAAN